MQTTIELCSRPLQLGPRTAICCPAGAGQGGVQPSAEVRHVPVHPIRTSRTAHCTETDISYEDVLFVADHCEGTSAVPLPVTDHRNEYSVQYLQYLTGVLAGLPARTQHGLGDDGRLHGGTADVAGHNRHLNLQQGVGSWTVVTGGSPTCRVFSVQRILPSAGSDW